MKQVLTTAFVLAIAGTLVFAQDARDPQVLFKAAQHTEEVQGNLKAAIAQYQQVVAAGNRALAAQALLRMAECHEKLGNAEARNIFQRIAQDYADQTGPAAIAQARLSGTVNAEPQRNVTLRRVWDGRASGLTAAVLTRVSGDGRRLSYIPFAAPTMNLHDLVTGSDRPLTQSDGCSGPSAISRDGKQVVYERYCGTYGSSLQLAPVMDSGVGESRRLFESADVLQITPMDLSPDGTLVAVTLVRQDKTRQIGLVATLDGSLRVLKSVDWRGPSRIFFSPDGRDLAFDLPVNDASTERDVFVLAVDGSRETPAVVHPANDIVMGWSPDGSRLLFASDRRGRGMGLWAQAFADRKPLGAPTLMTDSINSAWSLGVTNAGALYLGLGASDQDIAVASIDLATGKETGPAVKPIQSFLGTNLEPAWSPDGKSLAYISWRTNNPIFGDPRILAIRSVETGETRELRPNIAYFDQLSWSPDGRALVTAGSDLKGRNWIFRLDAHTGDAMPLVPLPSNFERACPQWSRDGTRIYYRVPVAEGASEVAFIERVLASGTEREIARGDLGSINLSPDGHWIAAQRSARAAEGHAVVLIPVDGGAPRDLFPTVPAQRIVNFSGIPWTPDGSAVLVRKIVRGDMRESTSELWLVPINGAAPRKLDINTNRWKAGNRGMISLSPDGRKIAYLTGQVIAEVWALEHFLPAATEKRSASKPR